MRQGGCKLDEVLLSSRLIIAVMNSVKWHLRDGFVVMFSAFLLAPRYSSWGLAICLFPVVDGCVCCYVLY